MKKNKDKRDIGKENRVSALKDLWENCEFKKNIEEADKIINDKKRQKTYIKIAEKYHLDFNVGDPLFKLYMKMYPEINFSITDSDFDNYRIDVCRIYDMPDELLNPGFPRDFLLPVMKNTRLKLEFNAYPIHIGIAPNTSKRMLIEFIENNWEELEAYIKEYYDTPFKIRRKRKNEQRDKLILELHTHGMKSKDIAEMINNHDTENILEYTDINKIISRMKKIRSQ